MNSNYWCGDGKICGIACDDLLDSDIFDDVQCAKAVFAAQQRLTQNGFEAWTTYRLNSCDRKALNYTSWCFDGLDDRGRPTTQPTPMATDTTELPTATTTRSITEFDPALEQPAAHAPPLFSADDSDAPEAIPPTTAQSIAAVTVAHPAPVPAPPASMSTGNHHNLQSVIKLIDALSSTDTSMLGRINLNLINVYNFFFHNQSSNTFHIN